MILYKLRKTLSEDVAYWVQTGKNWASVEAKQSETITCQSISSKDLLTEILFWSTFQNKLNNAKNSFEHVLFSTNLAANQTVLL